MPELRIALAIEARSALSVGAAGSAGALADKAIVRDGMGRPIIPGSQVKGKLRFAAEQLLRSLGQDIPTPFEDAPRDEQPTLIRAVFGSPQLVSPLRFADLCADLTPREARLPQVTRIRPSVTLNRRRGAAEDQRLVLQEVTREGLVFRSEEAITGTLDNLTQVALLWAAIQLTDRWGGAKSRGLGWCSLSAQVHWNAEPIAPSELATALRNLHEPQS